jgi:hypothetical protein
VPKDEAPGLTTTMRLATAAHILQVHDVPHATQASFLDSVTGFICSLIYNKLLATVLKHLGHHEQPITRPCLVKGGEDFMRRADANDLSSP